MLTPLSNQIQTMIKNSITALSFATLCGALFSCGSEQENTTEKEITLINRSSVELTDKAIIIKRDEFSDLPDGRKFPLLRSQAGDTIAAQLDDLDGDREWDELFFVTNLPAEGEQKLTLTWVDADPAYTRRTSVRFGKRESGDQPVQPKTSDTLQADGLPKSVGYQPYQTDGPSWENDKIGFRQYFDGRNAIDMFGKRTSEMSPEDVGINAQGAVEDNYHVMADWGRDILAVGNSAGLGGIALQIGDTLARLGVTVDDAVNNIETTTFNILAEGPVRSIMEFNYNNWRPGDHSYNVQEQKSIMAGMYAYKNTASVEGLQGNENLLVGLVNINTKEPVTEIKVDDKWVVLLTHDQQTYNRGWWLGMAIILPQDIYQGHTKAPETGQLSNSYFGKLKIEDGESVSYYAAGGWELSDEQFRDSTYFVNYVQDLTRQIAAEVDVEIQ